MPCLEISMPRQSDEIKQLLAGKLTEAFKLSSSYPIEALGIRFYEYNIGESVNGGIIWDGHTGKPYIHFVLHIPKQTNDEKTNLISNLTETFTQCLNKPDWQPVIYINEYPDENIGYDGLSIAQHKKTRASS